VAQHSDFSKISSLERIFNGCYIFLAVFQVAGYQVAKVRVNMSDNFFCRFLHERLQPLGAASVTLDPTSPHIA
jgi:hypothetical protein